MVKSVRKKAKDKERVCLCTTLRFTQYSCVHTHNLTDTHDIVLSTADANQWSRNIMWLMFSFTGPYQTLHMSGETQALL